MRPGEKARGNAHRDRSAGKRHGVKPGQRLNALFGFGQQLQNVGYRKVLLWTGSASHVSIGRRWVCVR